MSKKLKITLTSGLVGKKQTQRKVVEALGLKKYGSSVVHSDSPVILGMINKVHHLVTVTEDTGETQAKATKTAKPAKEAKPAAAKPKAKAAAK